MPDPATLHTAGYTYAATISPIEMQDSGRNGATGTAAEIVNFRRGHGGAQFVA